MEESIKKTKRVRESFTDSFIVKSGKRVTKKGPIDVIARSGARSVKGQNIIKTKQSVKTDRLLCKKPKAKE